jgi:hypothetical protein
LFELIRTSQEGDETMAKAAKKKAPKKAAKKATRKTAKKKRAA